MSDYNGLFIFNYPMPKHSFHEIKPRHLGKKWDFSTNMKVLYVFGQISNQLVPFHSFYLSFPSRKFQFIGLFHHLCYEISGHLSLREVVQIDEICIFMCRMTMVYSFLITRCPRLASQGILTTSLSLQNTNLSPVKSVFVKVFVRLHREKAWMSFPNTRRFVIYS